MPRVDAMRELRNVDLKRLVALKQRWRVSIAFLIQQTREPGLIEERRAGRAAVRHRVGPPTARNGVQADVGEGRRIHDHLRDRVSVATVGRNRPAVTRSKFGCRRQPKTETTPARSHRTPLTTMTTIPRSRGIRPRLRAPMIRSLNSNGSGTARQGPDIGRGVRGEEGTAPQQSLIPSAPFRISYQDMPDFDTLGRAFAST